MATLTTKYNQGDIVFVLFYKNETANKNVALETKDDFDNNFAKICMAKVIHISADTKSEPEYELLEVSGNEKTTEPWNEYIEESSCFGTKEAAMVRLMDDWFPMTTKEVLTKRR